MDQIRKKSINATANVLSAKAQIKSKLSRMRSDADVKAIKRARAYDDAPNYDSKGRPTEAFKARSVAESVKRRIRRRKN